jgi:8-oxo-dGTP diphosphatase
MAKVLSNEILSAPIFVDIAIETRPEHLVLIQRRTSPIGWALPGGYVDSHESLLQAAFREAFEETGLKANITEQLHTYSLMGEKGCKGITTLFAGSASGFPIGGDDALLARAFHFLNLPEVIPDHQRLVNDYISWRLTGVRPALEPLGVQNTRFLKAVNADDQVIVTKRKLNAFLKAIK